MGRVTTRATNLIGGVSQQPAVTRLPSQAEVQENFLPSPTRGLMRRNPTEHLALLGPNDETSFYHWINRDSEERYVIQIRDNDLKVFDLEGTEYPVHGPEDPYTPFFGYLTVTDGWDPSKFKALTVADYTFILNTSRNIQMDNTVTDDIDTVAGRGYVQVVQGNYSSKYQISLGLETGPIDEEVYHVHTWDGDETNTDNDATQSRWKVWWGATYAGGEWTLGTPGQNWTLSFTKNPGPVTDSVTVVAPAALAGTGVPWADGNALNSWLDDFASQFVDAINGLGSLKVTNFKIYGQTVYFEILGNTGLGGTTPFNISPSFTSIPTGGNWSLTELASATAAKLKSIATNDIALEFAKRINAASSIFYAKSFGSTIQITSKLYPMDRVDVEDSFGDGGMRSVNRKAQVFTDLPSIARNGYGVKVEGQAAALEDDYWVRFKSNDVGVNHTGSQGVWEEGYPLHPSTYFGVESRGFLETNMPYVLIRKQDDGVGTVTGNPDSIYFEIGPGDWNTRDVGDTTTNPNPSFVGHPIEDLFFFKNRLGFISGDRVIMSEAGRFFNFWRTTVRNLLDSDPIDVTASHVKAVTLKHAVPSQDNLVLFSDRAQLVLSADNLLTPRTVSISPVSDFEVSLSVRPVNLARSVLFARNRGSFSSLVEHYRVDEVSFDGQEITQHIPSYIEGTVKSIAFSESEKTIAVVTDGGEALYVYNYFAQGGELAQAAWHKFTFATGAILTAEFYEDTLYLLVARDAGIFLEKMSFSTSAQDPNLTYQVKVDRRIPDTALLTFTYDSGTNLTELELPFTPEDESVLAVATRADATHTGGARLPIDSVAGDSIFIEGDWTTFPLWIGETYESRYEFSPVTLKREGGRGQELILGDHIQILTGKIVYEKAGYFVVDVTPWLRPTIEQPFTGPPLAEELVETLDPYLSDGVFQFSVLGKNSNTVIEVHSDSPLPCSLLTAEWTLNYHSR